MVGITGQWCLILSTWRGQLRHEDFVSKKVVVFQNLLMSCEWGATHQQLIPYEKCLFIEDVLQWPFARWLRIWSHILRITFRDPSWIEATWWKCFQYSAWHLFSKIFHFIWLPNSVFNHHATMWRLTVWGFPKGETSQPHEIRALVPG